MFSHDYPKGDNLWFFAVSKKSEEAVNQTGISGSPQRSIYLIRFRYNNRDNLAQEST